METKLMPQPESLTFPWGRLFDSPYSGDGAGRLVQVLDEDGTPIAPPPEDLASEGVCSLYEWMLRLRTFDTRLMNLQRQGRIAFFVPSTGEEATMIGTAAALGAEDWVFPAYREHGVALFRGFPLEEILCQMYGNNEDLLKGRQMPNHFGSPRYRFAAASSPVGTQIPHAVGAAWSARLRGEASVAAAYFGDGATSTGDFHAGMTFAAVQHVPVVFFCKNNGWAISMPQAKQCRAERLVDKAIGYGMPGVQVDGNDALAVYEVAKHAVEHARSGSGPVFVELLTQRMGPHSTSDDPTRYRESELLEPWKKKDPLLRFRAYLEGCGLWSEEEERRAISEWDALISAAVRKVEPLPPPPLETIFQDVYAEMPWHLREQMEEACRRSP